LRANLLKYLEKANQGEQITVTTNGRILATIAPPANKRAVAKQRLNELSTTARINDVTSPIDMEWGAAQ